MANEIATVQNTQLAPGFGSSQSFELMQRVSKAFSSSELVPAQYKDKIANCMIAVDIANRIGASPLMVMQNLYIVHGSPSWSSKFLVATINACGRFSSLRYEWQGKPGDSDYGCRAWAVEKGTDQRLDGVWVTWAMVKAEGWDAKNGSKWKTMPDQMFVYRAAAFWQRAYAPELGMGLQTVEEIHDVIDVTPNGEGGYEIDGDGVITVTNEPDLAAQIEACTTIEALESLRVTVIQKRPADQRKAAMKLATERAAQIRAAEQQPAAEQTATTDEDPL